MPNHEYAVVAVDLETTGVDKDKDNIVQVAAVLSYCTGNEMTRPRTIFSTLCNPGHPIPEEVSKVHGITDEDVRWSPSQSWALFNLKNLVNSLKAHYKVVLAGQNQVRFDIPFMDGKLKKPFFREFPTLDTYIEVMRHYPTWEHKLGPLYEKVVCKKAVDAHDAAADCHMVLEILSSMVSNYDHIQDMINAQASPVVLDHMPFGKYKGVEMRDVPLSYIEYCVQNFTDMAPDIMVTLDHWLKEKTSNAKSVGT